MFLSRSDDDVIRVHNRRVDPVQTREDELNPAENSPSPNLRRCRPTVEMFNERRNVLLPLDYSQATIRKTRLMLSHQQQLPV
jgi:hypothetical protein